MDWDVEIKENESWPDFIADNWQTLLVKLCKGRSKLHVTAQFHDSLLCDHVESNFYSKDDTDLFNAVDHFRILVWKHHQMAMATPDADTPLEDFDMYCKLEQQREVAAKEYENVVGELEALMKIRSLYSQLEIVTDLKNGEEQLEHIYLQSNMDHTLDDYDNIQNHGNELSVVNSHHLGICSILKKSWIYVEYGLSNRIRIFTYRMVENGGMCDDYYLLKGMDNNGQYKSNICVYMVKDRGKYVTDILL